MNMKKMIGALTAKFAVAMMAFGCTLGAWALTVNVNDTSIELPAMQATLLDPADENFPNNNLNELKVIRVEPEKLVKQGEEIETQ